tara:strand:- start:4226 stop:5464 length:1239 start_codon:yes stop_codon:yes gene_type:complete
MKQAISNSLKEAIKKQKYQHDSYYIFDKEICSSEINFFKDSFKKFNSIFSYSFKTNYCKPLIDMTNKKDFLSEVVSPFEVDLTKLYNINPKKIIYNGPVKDIKSIEYVLKGNGVVNADNLQDLDLIIKTAQRLKINPRLGIRFSYESEALHSRFGIEFNSKNLNKIIKIFNINKLENIDVIHVHFPERNLNSFKNRLEKIFSTFKILKKNSINVSFIDIGGGFPSRMSKDMRESLGLEKDQILSKFPEVINNLRTKYKLEELPIIFEPGTAIASSCFHLVGNVHSINDKKDKMYINTDLSLTLLGGLKNKTYYPITYISLNDKKNFIGLNKNKDKILSGFSCVEGDLLNMGNIEILNPCINDKIVLSSVGSYSTVFKSPFIRGDIALFIWDGKQLTLSRRAQTANDILKLYK